MISVTEAREIVNANSFALPPVTCGLALAAGKILAKDIYATMDIPAYPQSSMDGYAFSFADWQPGKPLQIAGEMAAGTNLEIILQKGTAARIFTGAPVPQGADTVVMQEKTSRRNAELLITDDQIQAGDNLRPRGGEILAGQLALAANNWLGPGAVGFLAGISIAEVTVYARPSIGLIVTGNELQTPGKELRYGQVYESNSYALAAALKSYDIEFTRIQYVEDKPEAVALALKTALQENDIILFTGGISAGDYDYVLKTVTEAGVSQLFHKVKQRPGKPLYFGRKENKLVFGLPGNPSSVLTCFYQYVAAAIEKMSHRENRMPIMPGALAEPFSKRAGFTHFLKGYFDGMTVTILDAQESYRMHSFARANCLVQINEDQTECRKGEMVDMFLFQS